MSTSRRVQRVGVAVASASLVATALVVGTAGPAATEPAAAAGTAPGAPAAPTVNDAAQPLNVEGAPRFGWLPQDADPNEVQRAYQLQVRDGAGELVWDSGAQASDEQSNVAYAGPALATGASYTWQVRTWDRTDQVSPWSEPATFDTGIGDDDWDGAAWIKRTPGAATTHSVTPEGRLRIAGNGGAAANEITLAHEGAAWTDYELSMQVTPVSRGAGIVFRAPDTTSGYMWQLSPDGLKTHRRTGSAYPQDARRTVPVTPAIALGTTYDVRIRVEGQRFRTFVDGALVDDWTDPSATGSTAGTVGFRQVSNSSGTDTAEFDDVRVTSLDGGTELLADDFSDGLGQWAVPTGGVQEPDDWTLLRTDVRLEDKEVVRARSYVAGSHTYELLIDGERADRGQSFSYPGEGYYQAADITELVRGRTEIGLGAILHWYGSGQGRPAGVPGLLARIVVEYADGTEQVITSDDSWSARRGPYLPAGSRNGEGDFVEHYDATAAAAIGDWTSFGYDDSTWAVAEEIGAHPVAPFTSLTGQESRITETVVQPERILVADDGTAVADFGVVVPARPSVEFTDGVAGRVLPLRASYGLTEDGRVATSGVGAQGTNMSFPYTQVAGAQTFEAFTHLAFRYLEIPGAGEEITVDDVSATIVHTEVPEGGEAEFDSSDETLDEVWDLMARSALYSVQEQFVDTPTREKGQFLHDSVNISEATMLGFNERVHSRQAIREFLASQERYWTTGDDAGRFNAVYPNGDGKRDIPDFSLTVPGWVWDYYQQSGDEAIVAEAYDALRATAGYVLRHIPEDGPTAGLVTQLSGGSGPYQYGIVDWPEHGRFGYDMTAAARTTVNALSVDVLTRVADMGELLGEPADDVAGLRSARDDLAATMNAELRREDGLYVDGLLADGSQSAHAGQHSTSYAIAFDIAPEEDRPELAAAVGSMGMRQGPMTVHWLAEALREGGQGDALVALLTNPDDFGWAQSLEQGLTFTPEAWVQSGSANSQSHGWSANTMTDVVEEVVGIRIAEAGARSFEVVVPELELESASGTTHTQRGPVSVAWDRSSGLTAATVSVPVNTTSTVSVPVADGNVVAGRNGDVAAEPLGVEDGRALFAIGSGTWAFTETVAPEPEPEPQPGQYGVGSRIAPQAPWSFGRLGSAKPITVYFEGEDGSAVTGTVYVTLRRAGTAQLVATAHRYDGTQRQVATPVVPGVKSSYQVGVTFVPDDEVYRATQRHFWIWATPSGRP